MSLLLFSTFCFFIINTNCRNRTRSSTFCFNLIASVSSWWCCTYAISTWPVSIRRRSSSSCRSLQVLAGFCFFSLDAKTRFVFLPLQCSGWCFFSLHNKTNFHFLFRSRIHGLILPFKSSLHEIQWRSAPVFATFRYRSLRFCHAGTRSSYSCSRRDGAC